MKNLIALAATVVFSANVFAAVPDITIKDLKAAITDKAVTIIDVNSPESYKEGHVPTALSYDEIKGDFAKHLPADKAALVVAYCGGPNCGAYQVAAKKAIDLGYTNVKHLAAGISGWKGAGEKTEAVK